MMVTPAHAVIVEPFLADLRACVATLKETLPTPEGAAVPIINQQLLPPPAGANLL
jgi:hypothetical protein